MMNAEWRRIIEATEVTPAIDENLQCTLLTKEGRCSVYEIRPMVCRLFGVSIGIECPWGCKPSRLLSHEEGKRFLEKAHKIDGRKPTVATGFATEEQVAAVRLRRSLISKIIDGG